jgi:hypothetical protein
MAENNGKAFFNVTNILVTIAIAANGVTWLFIMGLDEKVFKHMTNDEIHAPRSQYVSLTTFDLYQKFRELQINAQDKKINDEFCSLKESINKLGEKRK